MPSLERVLRDYDAELLRIIGDLWGVEINAPSQRAAAETLAAHLRQPAHLAEVFEALPDRARAALGSLVRDGRLPLAAFQRRHGELRAMGPARRDREQPWRTDPSPLETLWYRGLIGRAFFDDGQGPQEFVFVPDDLEPLLAPVAQMAGHGRPPGESLPEPPAPVSALDLAGDDLTTLLAYLQVVPLRVEAMAFPRRQRESLGRFLRLPRALDFVMHLAARLELVSGSPLHVEPGRARPFLEALPAEQVASLAPAWRDSAEWNDLRQVPGLVFEGSAWRNDPRAARAAVLNLLREVPAGDWWSLESFVAAVKDRQPDFQRPAGDYDSWYIRDARTQAYLRGFENWDRVDGALVRWIIGQPLHWLGLVDLALQPPQAFRLTAYGAAFLGQVDWPAAAAPLPLLVRADGVLRVPARASRYDRFQAARITHWLPPEGPDYLYRLAPASLARAARQGIRVNHILGFLQKAAGGEPVPPSLAGALLRWERAGAEASLKETVLLRVKSPELLETLRRTPSIRRYLQDSLPAGEAVEVRREDLEALRAALAELGILVD